MSVAIEIILDFLILAEFSNSLEVVLLVILQLTDLLSQGTHVDLSESAIEVVVVLDVFQDSSNNVELTSIVLLDTCWIRDGALVSQQLGHVIIVDILKRLAVILTASAQQVVQVVWDQEYFPVHGHQLDQSHLFVSEPGIKFLLEDPFEGLAQASLLGIVKILWRQAVLPLKVPRVFHDLLRQYDDVDPQRSDDDERPEQNGQYQINHFSSSLRA